MKGFANGLSTRKRGASMMTLKSLGLNKWSAGNVIHEDGDASMGSRFAGGGAGGRNQ